MTREEDGRPGRVTVMGLGMFGGGAGVVRHFARQGAQVTVTDLASAEKLAPSIAALSGLEVRYVLGEHREKDFTDTDLVVANQSARPDNPYLQAARAAGVPVTTEIGLALTANRSAWIGVTGSSGKSTTASLIAEMLRSARSDTLFGGNIGGDLVSRTPGRPPDAPLVVELSSFQLTHLADDFAAGRVLPPRVAVLTNLTPNHLDWHRDFQEYALAKQVLFRAQCDDGWAILNGQDETARGWLQDGGSGMRGRVVLTDLEDCGGGDAAFLQDDAIVIRQDGAVAARIPLDAFRLPGRHNRTNAVQAAAAVFAFCRNVKAIGDGLARFPGLPHRLEPVGTVDGVLYINDSKSTTPEAAITALQAMDRPVVLIAGGYDKGSPFDSLAEAIVRHAVGVVLIGPAGERLGSALSGLTGRDNGPVVQVAQDFRQAVREAGRLVPAGGCVLLSPGCASYGMFVNYEERGERFRELIQAL